ncbi:hypothetical protein DNHGIG_20660 [Collibacillus ludicampi]|uniref:NodB homology domain-containing protein n=1 Tax=Collibacillus ludicampi TaxID=2771369 RepID=A0AAV4LFB3_9BACL|nr:polysaccharide deacetylase family protein [Collibacillus ludicampi]GIM46517.1 hypothetical protein DNHGIG_20660 [Collibacillus ludicampi]
MIKHFRIVIALTLASFLFAGCTTTETPKISNLNKPQQKTASTPDLADGPESQNRTILPIHKALEGSNLSGILFYKGPANVKKAALTFDDGPDIRFTPQILEILKRHGVKATFFIIGTRAQAHPEMVRRIAQEGHVIGNHTWTHPNLRKLSPGQVRAEIDKTNQELFKILGYYPDLFRPPYGSTTPSEVREIGSMGYKVIDWSVDTRDWAGTPTTQIMNYVRSEISPGGIILEHCAGGRGENLNNTINALPQIISLLKAQGFTLVTVPELLNIPATM